MGKMCLERNNHLPEVKLIECYRARNGAQVLNTSKPICLTIIIIDLLLFASQILEYIKENRKKGK